MTQKFKISQGEVLLKKNLEIGNVEMTEKLCVFGSYRIYFTYLKNTLYFHFV